LIVSAAILLNIFSGIENWKRDLTTNYAKLDSQSDDPSLRPISVPMSPQEAAEVIVSWASTQPRWEVIEQPSSDTPIGIHLVHKTRLLRFTDDIRVTLVPIDAGQTRVEAESQSRIGKGDFGQNPRNLRELLSAFDNDR
jgi:uncharacterized protein (DUF1499 family)